MLGLRVGSIFSGIGGLELGLERGGDFTTIFQCELNPFCRRILRQHWPSTHIFKDVRTLEEDIQYTQSKGFDLSIDLLCGGDPCQENSNARIGDNCTAPSMGDDFIRIVRFLRPTFVLRENPSAVRKDAPWPWWRFRSELEKVGYGVVPFRLRSCCLGGWHRRDRVYLFAARIDADNNNKRLQGKQREKAGERKGKGYDERLLDRSIPHAACIGSKRRRTQVARKRQQIKPATQWRPTPRVLGGTPRPPNAMDRIKALGNSVDIRQSTYIGQLIRTWLEGLC